MQTHVYYPGQVPGDMKETLIPVAKAIAYEFGAQSRREGLIVTDEMFELVALVILGAVSCGAHVALFNREALLANPEIKQWASTEAEKMVKS